MRRELNKNGIFEKQAVAPEMFLEGEPRGNNFSMAAGDYLNMVMERKVTEYIRREELLKRMCVRNA